MKRNVSVKLFNVGVIIVLVIALITVLSSMTIINAGTVGIRYRLGTIIEEGMPAGLYLKIPFIERISIVDITEQSIEYHEVCYTKDIQTVEDVSVKINYQYDPNKLSNLVHNVGLKNIESKIIKPQVEAVLKNEIGKYKAEELIANRTSIQEAVEDVVRNNIQEYGLNVISVNIQNLDFDDNFEAVIQKKVAAEQQLLTARTEAEKLKVEADAAAEAAKKKADAEAYAINVVNEAMKAMDSDAYVKLQWIEAWDGHLPKITSDGGIFYGLDGGLDNIN